MWRGQPTLSTHGQRGRQARKLARDHGSSDRAFEQNALMAGAMAIQPDLRFRFWTTDLSQRFERQHSALCVGQAVSTFSAQSLRSEPKNGATRHSPERPFTHAGCWARQRCSKVAPVCGRSPRQPACQTLTAFAKSSATGQDRGKSRWKLPWTNGSCWKSHAGCGGAVNRSTTLMHCRGSSIDCGPVEPNVLSQTVQPGLTGSELKAPRQYMAARNPC